MSQPRQILPGTYLITRRCTQRQFLLKPSAFVNLVFRFCLAVAAEKYSIEIHAYCVMSNHVHLLMSVRSGNIPKFAEWLFRMVARVLNARYKRSENFWSNRKYSLVKVLSPTDALRKLEFTDNEKVFDPEEVYGDAPNPTIL